MRLLILTFFIVISPVALSAQDSHADSTATNDSAWSYSIEGYYYLVPYSNSTPGFTVMANHRSVHLEARYNYEDVRTASVFYGYNFSVGDKLQLTLTPMAGFAFVRTTGFIPSFEIDFSNSKFDFYSESEYMIDFTGKENDFFYTWNELGINLAENFSAGLVEESTKLFETKLDIQKGIFAAFTFGKFTVSVYYFNPFSNKNYFVPSLVAEF
jgi:hypothetical protein